MTAAAKPKPSKDRQANPAKVALPTHLHPLDPLSEAEITLACELLKSQKKLPASTRFAFVQLEEPLKSAVLAWQPGKPLMRSAATTVFDTKTGATHVGIVDLDAKKVVSWLEHKTTEYPYGQPPVIIEEFFKVGEIVKKDPGWLKAMKRRGLTDKDIALIQVDPFSAGYYGRDVEKGRRVVSAVSYYRENLKDNGYAHPIEGVVALVDLIAGKVLELVDEPDIVPIPKTKRNYHREDLPPQRTTLKPLDIVQRDGPSFKVDGWKVEWQNWSFRIGFSAREGLILNQIAIKDNTIGGAGAGKERPIVYRASLTEMVVPYSDPTANNFWKNAFDAGEYGLGKLANTLELGCDCLGHIQYFDVPVADDHGVPLMMKNVICMHEEDFGVLWKHYEFRTDTYEMRRSRRLVISFFATVGNYDYGFYWYLFQDGTIQLEAKLTGIIQTSAVKPGASYPWGGMVGAGLAGPTHQHIFNVRLHMMVDGEQNTVTEHEFVPRPWGRDNPYGNVFDTTSRVLARERDAARECDGRTGRYWKVINPNRKNSVGGHPGYKLVANPAPLMLAQPGSSVHARGGFATKNVWVTQYDPAERYASGDFPNQHAGGDGLPKYSAQNREIENKDIVLWHTFAHTHVCKPEDMPVMAVEYAGFTLKPNGFFASNPAMDLPPDKNAASKDQRAGEGTQSGASCCD